MSGPYTCSHAEDLNSGLAEWPPGTVVTWHQSCAFPTLAPDQTASAIREGVNRWSEVCGVQLQEVADPATARLIITSQAIDGPFGVLGETQLPFGVAGTQLWMHLDMAERWAPDGDPGRNAIILSDVVWHEMGHGIGLGHAPSGSANIMAPVYNPATTGFGPFDTSQSQARYGPPQPVSAPPPTDPGIPFDTHGTVTIGGKPYVVKVTGVFVAAR